MNGDYVGPPLGEAHTLAEVSEYVAAAWSTYEQMREARDQALGRAEVAERELAAANAALSRVRAVVACWDEDHESSCYIDPLLLALDGES